jgi:hypothetical protein
MRKVAVQIPYEAIAFCNGPGIESVITETSTKNLPGVKGRPALKADNLTAFCEKIV